MASTTSPDMPKDSDINAETEAASETSIDPVSVPVVARTEAFGVYIQDNPFKEGLSLTIESPDEQQALVRLTDLTGKVIHESTRPTNTLIEIAPQVPNQILFLSVRTGRNRAVKRVVKME
jgi:hypothetical protein